MKSVFAIASLVSYGGAKKCPFGYGSDDTNKTDDLKTNVHPRVLDTIEYPSQILVCPSNKSKVLTTPSSFNSTLYESISTAIFTLFNTMDSTTATNFAACNLRLAGHDFMDFRRTNGVSS
jgi:hypothetical protein